jgi:hypothetical protein
MRTRFAPPICRNVAAAFGFAVLGCGAEPNAVVPAAEPLVAATADFPEPFTGPIRMVELPDGRLLLMDTRERRLVRVDFASGTLDTISQIGDGPLEYRSMFVLAAAPGDSVWGFDIVRGRILVFSSQGEPIRSFSTLSSNDPMLRVNAPWLRSVDSAGRWLGRAQRLGTQSPRISDTLFVLRMDPRAQTMDTIAVLQGIAPRRNADGSSIVTNFEPRDEWAAFSDGGVLVVRGADYRVELYDVDGAVERVGPMAYRPVPLTASDAAVVRDSVARQVGALVASAMANMPVLEGRAPPPTHVLPAELPQNWPLLVGDDAPIVDGRDRVWLRVRTAAFDTGGTRYDVLDRRGRFERAVWLPAGEAIVGIGKSAVYVSRRDADGLLWLRRHPIP